MARRRGGQPGPGIPALALGSAAGGADLPAPLVPQQRPDRFRAGQLRPCRQGEHEVRRHPQHVRLAVLLEELAQLRAVPVDLVPAGEVEADAVGVRAGADVDGQLSLGAESQIERQAHQQGLHRVLEVLAGDPLPGADQRVPGLVPHVGQVDGVDPVGHPARAPQVLALDSRSGLAGLSCPVSSIAPITRPRRRPLRRAASSSPATANRRTTPIAAKVSQLAWFCSRWVLSGVRSPACRAMLHPFRSGSSLITAAVYLPACSHGPVRAKHGRSSASSSFRLRSASPAPILTAAAASDFELVTQASSRGGCAHACRIRNKITSATPRHLSPSSEHQVRLPY